MSWSIGPGPKSMVIVTGMLHVAPAERPAYLAGCLEVVEQARAAPGCLDFALSADLLDPGRVNVLERWTSRAAVETFRGEGPSGEQASALLSAEVSEFEVSSERVLT